MVAQIERIEGSDTKRQRIKHGGDDDEGRVRAPIRFGKTIGRGQTQQRQLGQRERGRA